MMNSKNHGKRKSQGEREIKTLVHHTGTGLMGLTQMHKCCHEQDCLFEMGLGKEESGERTKRTWESFKLSEKESEAKKKNARKKQRKQGTNELCSRCYKGSKVMVAWGEMQGEHQAKWGELLETTTQTRQSSLAENRSPHTLQNSIFLVLPALRDQPQLPTGLQKTGEANFYAKCL